MKDQFPGWNPPTEEELHSHWQKGLIAIDANVLLNAYRYSRATRTGLLAALEGLADRLWVPHRAAEEFHRNRLRVLIEQRICHDQLEADIDDAQRRLVDAFTERLRSSGRRDTDAFEEAVTDQFKELRKRVRALDKEHQKGLGDRKDHRDDPLYDQIVELLAGKIGLPLKDEQLADLPTTADQRFQNNLPPGGGDADKETERRYGDVMVWFQLIAKAEEANRPIIFVTDDQKDWMWEVKGRIVGPKPHLVAELAQKAGQPFHAYSTAQFVRVASMESGKSDENALEELETSPDVQEDRHPRRSRRLPREHVVPRHLLKPPPQLGPFQAGTAVPSSGRFVPSPSHDPAFTSHQVLKGEVTLFLHGAYPKLAGQVIYCEVLDPFHNISACVFPSADQRVTSTRFTCSYPFDFPGAAQRLIQGEPYIVRWKESPTENEIGGEAFFPGGEAEASGA